MKLSIVIFIFAIFFAPSILASAKSDYDFQYGQYRQYYPEYRLLKADYLNTSS
ncbi:MAG: hypothetical protein UW84_C0012G0026, partial [Candidatus Collierbacteria bacterium GW2011_GWA2_44_99]